MNLEEMTMSEFADALKGTKTMILPYGTVEAHGTHLPLSTDTLIIHEAVKLAAESVPVFIAPPIHYGVCTSTGQHAGTVSISTRTLRMLTKDIVREAYKKGLRNFILISGHGGSLHVSAIKEAGESLTGELKEVKIAALSIYDIIGPEGFEIAETRGDSHAGELETSAVLFLAPELVKGRAQMEFPKFPRPVIARDKLKFWPGAVWGDPTKATVGKGREVVGLMAARVVKLVKDIEEMVQ